MQGLPMDQILDHNLSAMSKRLYLIATTVCETRTLMKLESYEEVLEMYRNGKLSFAVTGRDKDDSWTPAVLSSVRDEVKLFV